MKVAHSQESKITTIIYPTASGSDFKPEHKYTIANQINQTGHRSINGSFFVELLKLKR